MGPNATFRTSSSDPRTFFNPTSTEPPFFQVFDEAFLSILGESASIHQVAVNNTFAFAHEAPIYNEETDELFFASNDGGALGNSDIDHNNVVSKISMTEVERQLAEAINGTVDVPVTPVEYFQSF